ncbi:MAG: hypothetical protein PHE52_01230 [Candidatus Pacebacteria bacterium]|nr:hypothetical protein [Candidatus Paceibacterota bacterium]
MLGLILPVFSLAQTENQVTPPETLDEAKQMGEKALEVGQKELPGIIERIWKEEVMPIWQKMFDWFKANIWPKIADWFKKFITPEIEKRKPVIEGEFQKEKQEMKESAQTELPKAWDYLWEKFKQLISTK